MSFLSIGILTAPRPKPTLAACIESLQSNGFPPPHVFADEEPHASVRGVDRLPRAPHRQNLLRMCRFLVGNKLSSDYVMILEDDVTFVDGALETLKKNLGREDLVGGDFGILSLHCMRKVSRHLETVHGDGKPLEPGVYESHLGWRNWGAQCLVMPWNSLWLIHKSGALHSSPGGKDKVIFEACEKQGLRVFYLLPCIARHELGINNSSLDSPELKGRTCDY